MKKTKKRIFAKNNIIPGSFQQCLGSILDKTSSKVIKKMNAHEIHHYRARY
jgi:hypothetical protein